MDKKPDKLTQDEIDRLDIEAAEKSLAELGENITLELESTEFQPGQSALCSAICMVK